MRRSNARRNNEPVIRENLEVKVKDLINSEYAQKRIENGAFCNITHESDQHHIISAQLENNRKDKNDISENNKEYHINCQENMKINAQEKLLDVISKESENALSQGNNDIIKNFKK